MVDPYVPPQSRLSQEEAPRYVGFWARTFATIVDWVLISIITMPTLFLVYGAGYFESDELVMGSWDVILNYVFPAVVVLLFWRYKSATPGKMLMSAVIVDADTGAKPSMGQLVGRYFGYIPSMVVLGLGYFWVAWDPKKQGWHDKLAGTVVVRRNAQGSASDVELTEIS